MNKVFTAKLPNGTFTLGTFYGMFSIEITVKCEGGTSYPVDTAEDAFKTFDGCIYSACLYDGDIYLGNPPEESENVIVELCPQYKGPIQAELYPSIHKNNKRGRHSCSNNRKANRMRIVELPF